MPAIPAPTGPSGRKASKAANTNTSSRELVDRKRTERNEKGEWMMWRLVSSPCSGVCANIRPRVPGAAQRGRGLKDVAENWSRGALQTRDRSGLWRARISGAPRAHSPSRTYLSGLRPLVLHRIRDTHLYPALARGLQIGASCTLLASLAATIVVSPQVALADKSQPIDQRKAIYAPWSPDQMAQRRRELGLIGPGTTKPVPPPAFPSYLQQPDSIEQMM